MDMDKLNLVKIGWGGLVLHISWYCHSFLKNDYHFKSGQKRLKIDYHYSLV